MNNYNNYFNLNDHAFTQPNLLIKSLKDQRTLLTSKSSRKKLSIDLTSTPRIRPSRSPETHFSSRSLKPAHIREKSCADLSSNFLKGFLNMERKSQNLLNIVNRKWDQSLRDCLQINYPEKFIEIMGERKLNVDGVFNELLVSLMRTLGESNMLDSLKLIYAEQGQMIQLYEEFLRRDPENNRLRGKIDQSAGVLEKNRSNFDDLAELLRVMLRLFLKKFTDLTVYLENKEEGVWNNRFNLLKMRFRLQKNTGELVKHVEDFESLFNELLGKITELSNDKAQLTNELGALKKTIEKSFLFSKAETKEILMKPQKDADFSKYSLDFLTKFENIYKKSQDELKIRNTELTEEVQKLKKSLDEKQDLLNDRLKKRRLLKNSNANQREDKEVQINLGAIIENPKKTPLLHPEDNPLAKYLTLSLNVYRLDDFYMKSLINLMFSDKIFDDYQDYLEKTPLRPFKNYIFEWFLMRFGNQTYAETLLRDFLGSAVSAINESDRYLLLSRFCGINLEAFTRNIKPKVDDPDEFLLHFEESQEKASISHDLLNSFYSSTQAISVYLKLAHMFKHQEKDFDVYSPLLPDGCEERYLIPYENADRLLKTLLEQELNDEHLAFEIANSFNIMVTTEKLPKMVRKAMLLGGTSPKRNSLASQKRISSGDINAISPFLSANATPGTILKGKINDFLIPFDVLAKFIIDNLAKLFAVKIEMIVTSLKLFQANRKVNDFFLEDFLTVIGKQFPNKSNKWLINSFSEFICRNKNHEVSGVYSMIFNHLQKLLQPDFPDKFFLESFDKKEKKPEEKEDTPVSNNNEYFSSNSSSRSLKKKKTSGPFITLKRNMTAEENPKEREREQLKLIHERSYSFVDSIVVLLHTYQLLRENIRKEEVSNEILEMSHEIFKKEIMRFPQNLHLVKSNYWNKFVGYDRSDLVLRVEGCWKTMRLMIDCVYSRGEREKKENK